MGRALLRTLAALIVLAATGLLLWTAEGGPAVPTIAALQALDPAALGTALRLGVWATLAVLLLLLVLRVAVALALLFDLGYAPLAYLGQVLALPAVQKAAEGVAAGVMLAQLAGQSGVATAAQVTRGGSIHMVAARVPASASAHAGTMATPSGATGNAGVRHDEAGSNPSKGIGHSRPPMQVARNTRVRQVRQSQARMLLVHGAAKAQGSVLYTVQIGDTLSGIARRFYGDALAYSRLFRANAGRVQGDGQRLTMPWLVQPGWRLLVPLPSPVVTVDGNHLRYVVQQGDSLSGIAAGLLGDWQRYRELIRLNGGRIEPEGATLANPSMIQPGWTVLLPLDGVYVPPRPARTSRPISRPTPVPVQQRKVPVHPSPRTTPVEHRQTVSPAPLSGTASRRPPAQHEVPRHLALPVSHPRPQSRPALLPHAHSAQAGETQQISHRPARLTPRTRPTVLMPDGRAISAALAALFLGAVALAAPGAGVGVGPVEGRPGS